ncbi:MAG: hypothetical protein ABI322_07145 [Gemmatimonadaceae bacterium]
MVKRFALVAPGAMVLAVAFVLACSDSTAPSVPQYPHSAASMRLVSGDSQTALVGTNFAKPFVIEVLDSVGQPAWGRRVSVGWNTDSATTDRNGRAVVTAAAGTVARSGGLGFDPEDQGYSPATHVLVHVTVLARPFARLDTALVGGSLPGLTRYLSTSRFSRDNLFAAVDTFGNRVVWPPTKWLLPAGWTARGDTAIPPATGAVGTFALGLQGGGSTAMRNVLLLDDLRQYRWQVTWACGGGQPNAYYSDDSTFFSGTVHAMAYPGDPGYQEAQKFAMPEVQPLLDGAFTTVYPDGHSTTTTVSGMWVPGMWQERVDTLDYWADANMGTPTGKTVVRQPGPLSKYVGGSWCNPSYYSRRWPVTLVAY